jgi:hypothetical protein
MDRPITSRSATCRQPDRKRAAAGTRTPRRTSPGHHGRGWSVRTKETRLDLVLIRHLGRRPASSFHGRLSSASSRRRETLTIGGAVSEGAGAVGTRRSRRELRLAARPRDALGGVALGHVAVVVDAAVDVAEIAMRQVRPQGASADAKPLRGPAATGDVADGHQVARGSTTSAPPALSGRMGRRRPKAGPTSQRCRRRAQRPAKHLTPRGIRTQVPDDPVERVAFHHSPFLSIRVSRLQRDAASAIPTLGRAHYPAVITPGRGAASLTR